MSGVTVMVAEIGDVPVLVAVNEAISPDPLADKPIAVLELVHENVPPAGVLVKFVEGTDPLLQTVMFAGTITVGADGTGYDVQLFGDTSGCSMLWDESEDQLVITGPADVPALKIAGAGSFSAAAYAAAGSAWGDGETPAFVADQKYLMIDYAGTVYRIPVFANA